MSSAVTDAIDATEHERLRPRKPRGMSADKCAQMMRYLLLAWDVKNIAEQCKFNVSLQTVYTVENNRISMNRSETLRRAYLDNIRRFVAEDLIFLDGSIFNEKTGWRHHAYAPIGSQCSSFLVQAFVMGRLGRGSHGQLQLRR